MEVIKGKAGRGYFLLLFFWLAAIFSLDVIGAALTGVTFPSAPGAGFASLLSTFRLFPLEVSLSLMRRTLWFVRVNSLLNEQVSPVFWIMGYIDSFPAAIDQAGLPEKHVEIKKNQEFPGCVLLT